MTHSLCATEGQMVAWCGQCLAKILLILQRHVQSIGASKHTSCLGSSRPSQLPYSIKSAAHLCVRVTRGQPAKRLLCRQAGRASDRQRPRPHVHLSSRRAAASPDCTWLTGFIACCQYFLQDHMLRLACHGCFRSSACTVTRGLCAAVTSYKMLERAHGQSLQVLMHDLLLYPQHRHSGL